jgi:putative NIF3 family GTP cyclohydrolase 1 type 2
MQHSLTDYHKIYQALEGSLSSISMDHEGTETIQESLMNAKLNLDKAFQYELLRQNRIYD